MHSTAGGCQDHPHIHGEYWLIKVMGAESRGSPPYTWGILAGGSQNCIAQRITPIYMGNTRRHEEAQRHTKDHPHIHGEYCIGDIANRINKGSPPYTWGIPGPCMLGNMIFWITPIYMGNTLFYRESDNTYKDHPHIHGEYCQRAC